MLQITRWLNRFPALARITTLPKPMLMGGAAALVALLAVAALWMRAPDYKVLFANLEDRDGGAVVAALTQMQVPYQFSDHGAAILVPADKVHMARLQLAEQGLPKTGQVGFEVFDNTRFGASQFNEQVSYQRGLEGELATSIETLHAVQKARVHLALPRETLFVRERRAPTASVLLTLYPGRALNPNQVASIGWLVSSSVPGLELEHVSVVDQNGHLLSASNAAADADEARAKRTHEVEERAIKRIMTVLTPILGQDNVRAQVSAELDFAQAEETSEVYTPNQTPGSAAIRSQQTSDAVQSDAPAALGVPGALSNQPPADPVAPIDAPAAPGASTPAKPVNTRHDGTINYEVDRTIRHVKAPVGSVQRLSAAVVVNYRLSAEGEPQALSEDEMENIQNLVREAMGFDAQRGDTMRVVNSPFTDGPAALPVWKDPDMRTLALDVLKYLLIALAVLLLWRKVAQPFLANMQGWRTPATPAEDASAAPADVMAAVAESSFATRLSRARQLAQQEPGAVAMVIRAWMEKDGRN